VADLAHFLAHLKAPMVQDCQRCVCQHPPQQSRRRSIRRVGVVWCSACGNGSV